MRTLLAVAALAGCGGGYDGTFNVNPDPPRPTGSGTIEVSETELEFRDLRVGSAKSLTLAVSNTNADYALEIVKAVIEEDVDDAFYAQEDSFAGARIAPLRSIDWTIVCTLPAEDRSEAWLRISTKDPTQPLVEVHLVGTPWGWTGDTDTDG